MISKLAKARDNWIFKLISVAVAASFVSLFGVSGYITSAGQNRTVITVGNDKISQSEFMYRNQRELNALKNLAGGDLEITDKIKTSVANGVIEQMVDDSVLDQIMDKYDIYFPRVFVQQAIFSQPEFQNPTEGGFNPEIFKQYLNTINMSEDDYVAMVKRLIARRMLITNLIGRIEVPTVLSQATHKMDNQRKIFKYLTISPEDVKIERQITEDEIKQYFEDFSEQFIVPEKRDVELLFVSNDLIFNKYVADEKAVRDYYDANKNDFNQPEKRNVAQMVFMDQVQAEKAFEELKKGTDFSLVAKNMNADNANEPSLGLVAQDELAEDLAYDAFEAKLNEPKLLQVADTWQVIKITEIIPAKEATYEESKDKITEILKNENLYDAISDVRADIDDAVNAEKTLAEISHNFGLETFSLKDITESDLVQNLPENIKSLGKTLDLNELVFSYGLDEVSSAEEYDDGIVVLKVSAIKDSHLPEIEEVKDEIIALWTVQEKDALTKEIAENIVNDVQDGTDIAVAAKARDLEVYRSEPISRNETFASLSATEINDLFVAPENEVKSFEHFGNKYVIALPFETVNYTNKMDDEALKSIKSRVTSSLLADMEKSSMANFKNDFKVEIRNDLLLIGFEG